MKLCYYEVLGLSKTANKEEIKNSYHKLALFWHPDKNIRNQEEAKNNFQQIQEAYECLSDPQERAWYDTHREKILRGNDKNDNNCSFSAEKTENSSSNINIYSYFSSSCFKDFTDNHDGFFSVFNDLFKRIHAEELDDLETYSSDKPKPQFRAPEFGGSKSTWEDVQKFYSYWQSFVTMKSFKCEDIYHYKDAQNRFEKRLFEKENKKLRKAASREYSESVRALVNWIKKRDTRFQSKIIEQIEKKRLQAELEKKKKIEAEEIRRLNRQIVREKENSRWKCLEKEKELKVKEGYFYMHDNEEEEKGVFSKSDSMESDENENTTIFKCEICNKVFKSINQLNSHLLSKKHVKNLQMSKAFLSEAKEEIKMSNHVGVCEKEEKTEEVEGKEEIDQRKKLTNETKKKNKNESVKIVASLSSSSSSNEDESDAEEFLSRFSKLKFMNQKRNFKHGKSFHCEEEEEEEQNSEKEKEEEEEEEGCGEGKEEEEQNSEEEKEEEEEEEEEEKGCGEEKEEEKRREEKNTADLAKKREIENAQLSSKLASSNGGKVKEKKKEKKKSKKIKAQEVITEEKTNLIRSVNNNKEASSTNIYTCKTCNENFVTRNKLFQHIKAVGHATTLHTQNNVISLSGRRKQKKLSKCRF